MFIILKFQSLPSEKKFWLYKVILHQFWVKKMSQVEICSQQLEICKSVWMFIVLAIIVDTD